MAVIKKYGETLTQNLSSFQTYVLDTNPNSTYFKITEFKDTFTGGKNGFLIEGTPYLKESTELKVQILDVNGDPIYYEPGNGVPEYYEGTSKVVAVYIYEDTPIGTAKITILGELKQYLDEGNVVRDVPEEWKNVYNVKWEKEFKVNRLLSNEDKVRFYRRPVVNITEIIKPIFNNVTTTITQTGLMSGQAQAPRIGESLSEYSAPTTYLLEIEDTTNWTGSIVGNTISVPSLGYSSNVDSVINNKQVLVTTPYTVNGLVSNFLDENYTTTFNYVEGVNNLKTALTGSFAKINIADLETFVGDVARVKVFRKSQSDISDYQFIQEIKLESNEILRDLESQTKNEEFYGIFDNSNYKQYWVTSSNSLSTSFNQNYLYNSVKLDSTTPYNFYTSKSLDITGGTEYTFTFNTRVGTNSVNANNYIKAFLSGSTQTLSGVTQNIVTVTSDNSLLQKSQISVNFRAESLSNAKLYFETKGNDWYISDVSLRASQETSYSPNEITFIQSVPRTLPEETFLYRFEFYDINNNYIPVLVEQSKTFDGGNLQKLQKGLVFNPRSLQFQFDSGSQPVPPTVVGFTVTKNLLTGSVTYTSQSFDFDGNELFGHEYTASITVGGGYPGLLDDITSDAPTMTVQHFTGSRTDKTVQLIKITGEVEGYTDTVIFSRVLDGFGGVNYVIRPYRGTQIKNSSTQSLEIQAVRIDGVNDIELSSLTKPEKGWPDKQLHILSRSLEGNEKFVNLAYASSSRFIVGLTSGSLGSGQINYNAIFNRDSIDIRRTVYLMSSQSAASGPAYDTSGSILYSIILEDLQDGLDTGVVTYNSDTFNIDPRNESLFRPTFAFATASFYKRGTTDAVTASFQVFPSMSLNQDWTPEYWLYYTTQSVDPNISVVAIDEAKRIIPSRAVSSFVGSPLSQSKNLTFTFTYTEPYNSPSANTASISIDKTFTIVPQGTPGDETIIFEVVPSSITLAANSRGIVNDYKPSITDIKLKQGSRYLSFSSSAASHPFYSHGQFYIATSSIIEQNVKAGNVHFTSSFGTQYTASLIVSQSSNFTNLSGSITYPLVIHPYYTSSIYTASVVVPYTKVLDGPPPIQIVISPTSVAIPADEVGYVSNYTNANTSITVKEGDDFLLYNTSSLPGTWKINSIETRQGNNWNIRTGSLVTGSVSSSFGTFNRFDYPFVSASATYTIQVYPFALGSGHQYTSSIFTRTQTFTKNVSVPNARTVELKASSATLNYSRDGYLVSPEDALITLTATAFNTTGSVFFRWYYIDEDGSEVIYQGPDSETTPGEKRAELQIAASDAAGPGENRTWKVKIWDGDNDGSSAIAAGNKAVRAEGQVTLSGIKAGADAYKVSPDNINCSITAELFSSSSEGTAIKLPTYKGTTPLINVTTGNYPAPQATDYDYVGDLIGILGYSSASIYYKSPWIVLGNNPTNRITTNPASMPNIMAWDKPAINKSGEIVYKIEFEGYSTAVANDLITRPPSRQTEFVTQSFSVQFTEPAPYDIKMQNDSSPVVYRVSGEVELNGTGNTIRAYRGTYALTHKPSGFVVPKYDSYGSSSYEYQYRVQVSSKSSHITLGGGLVVGSYLTGDPASFPGVTAWNDPETNQTAEIVYEINCEGRQTFYKTQSLAIQFEGAVGPGIVMRGEWDAGIDYIGMVETTNNRRDAVTYLATPDTVKYYAAVSGSGPATYDQNGVLVNYHAPTVNGTNAWWEYLGDQEFFVAAKIAIFEESYVKNTINVGTKNGTGAFANIVIAGGRTDPYIAIGQNATIGTSGGSGTTLNPGGSVIGYDRPGIFLGIYEQGAAGTTGRFSIKDTSGNRYVKWNGSDLIMSGKLQAGSMELGTGVNSSAGNGLWLNSNNYWYDTGTSFKVGGASNYLEWDGSTLTLRGSLKQTSAGANEGRLMGAWAAGVAYITNDIVTYSGNTWTANSDHTSTNNTNAGTGYPGYGPWTIAPIASSTLVLAASSQVFIEAKDGTLSPNYIELIANKQNISSTTNWTASPSVTFYDAATGGSTTTTGNTVYLRKADFGTNNLVLITATAGAYSDSVTVGRVQEGSDAISIFLTNEAHTLPADSSGVVSDYNGSGTLINLYEGATQLDYDGVGSAAGKWTVIASGTNITAGAISDGGNYASVANHSSATADQCSVSYTISGKKLNGDAFSITKYQTLTKAKQGATGANGIDGPGVVYRGNWASGVTYYKDSAIGRRDIVKQASNTSYPFWICKVTHVASAGNQPPTSGNTSTTQWESFGAQFTSVATDILLAQDATITRGLVIGTDGLTNGFIRSTGATGLTTGNGFYLQQDGKFRYGGPTGGSEPYIYWDNSILTIKGKIVTDNNSTIGSWQVVGDTLQDSAGTMKLNPDVPALEIYDTGKKLVDIRKGSLSNTSGTGTVTINGPQVVEYSGGANYDAGTWPGSGTYIYSTTSNSVTVSTTGQYYLASPSYSTGGSLTLYMEDDPDNDFDGYVAMYVTMELHTVSSSPNSSTAVWYSPTIAYAEKYAPGGSVSLSWTSYDLNAYLEAGTYYVFTRIDYQGGISSGDLYIDGDANPGSVTLTLQLEQTEITEQGILAVSDANNFFRVDRSDYSSAPYVTIKSNQTTSSTPTLLLENSGASGLALKVQDGDVDMNNNQITKTSYVGWNQSGNNGALTTYNDGGTVRPTIYLNNLGAAYGSGTTRGVEIRVGDWWLGRNTSALRFKRDIETWSMDNLLDNILKVPVREYSWKSDTREIPNREVGIVAEELEAAGFDKWVDYDWYNKDPNDPESEKEWLTSGIGKSELVFVLWKAVQELTQKVKSLESHISGSL